MELPISKTILLAEPNGAVRELLNFYFEQKGYHVTASNTSRLAWKAINTDRPDLVILNVLLPKEGGLKLVNLIRQSPGLAELPVIVLTEIRDKRMVLAMAKFGVEHYLLTSRLKLSDLIAAVEAAIAPPAASDAVEVSAEAAPPSEAEAANDSSATEEKDPAEDAASAEDESESALDLSGVSTLKDVKPLIKRSTIQDALDECGDLKGLTPAIAQVLKLTRKENCSIEAVAKAVKQDQGVSLKLLKLANSSIYERGEPVDTIPQAIMRMGLDSVRQAALNLSVVDQYKKTSDPRLEVSLFWEHSIATGLIASAATRAVGGDDDQIDSAFTMGLLHDTGRMVYNELFPDDYRNVLDVADHLSLPLNKVESRLLLINHAEGMDRVLRSWRFPKQLIDPIALHHLSAGNIRRMAPKAIQECCILALSNALAHALLLGHSGNSCLYDIQEYLAALNLGQEFTNQIIEEIPEQTLDIKLAMLANSGGTSMDYLKYQRDQLDQPVRPLIITDDVQIDPIQIMLNRLIQTTADDAPPNLAIMRLTRKRQVASMTRQLREAEQDAEVSGLPLIVISPSGEFRSDKSHANAVPRQEQCLAMPLHIGQFIKTVNSLLSEPEQGEDAA